MVKCLVIQTAPILKLELGHRKRLSAAANVACDSDDCALKMSARPAAQLLPNSDTCREAGPGSSTCECFKARYQLLVKELASYCLHLFRWHKPLIVSVTLDQTLQFVSPSHCGSRYAAQR